MEPRVVRSSAAVWRRAPHVLVVCVPPGPVWEIDGSGPLVWDALGEPAEPTELVTRVARSAMVDEGAVVGDVLALLDDLRARGLVVDVGVASDAADGGAS